MEDALLGKILQGTYRIEREIGSGGMGSVYEASHQRLGKRFAVKVLSPDVAGSAEALARFRQEALVTSALGNPNIVEVFDFNHMEDGTPYIVMEYLRGEDLASRLQRVGRLPLAKAVEIFRQAASALHAAHQKGIIHRDLKPQNVFLSQLDDRDDYVKIVDFGISKVVGSRHAMTGTHELLGSPSYMSPEQALVKASLVDLRADIFTMGTLVYLMLAGRPPFLADTMPDL
ncbi:MAG: serine/threonine-protein kinase, partial [Myxococcota bacterium]|nr:serine/threonine-protein kinase [Myxococcota bacterium]